MADAPALELIGVSAGSGDTVVLEPPAELADGDAVRIAEADVES